MKFVVEVLITRKPGVADPEGNTIKEALKRLGYENVDEVRTAKVFYLTLEADSPALAKETAEKIGEKILANPVIENFRITNIEEG